MTKDESPLVLPLVAVFVAFFVAPLCVLVALSFSTDANITAFTPAYYVKFFGDRFNYAILFETLLLGLKATLVCLIFGYPIAWICARSGARLQSIIVFLVILPILTSVVVRTFAWIVILGRQGIINQVLDLVRLRAARLLYTEVGVVMVLAQVQMPLMVLPILTVLTKIDPNLADASRVLGAGEWRTLFRITLAAVDARRDRRLHPCLYGRDHGVRDADADRRCAAASTCRCISISRRSAPITGRSRRRCRSSS